MWICLLRRRGRAEKYVCISILRDVRVIVLSHPYLIIDRFYNAPQILRNS